jgi:DNA-binding NarL/FixJ family response regulator
MKPASDRPEDIDGRRAAGVDGYVLKAAANEEIIGRMAAARPNPTTIIQSSR